jgi:hypothetical protein
MPAPSFTEMAKLQNLGLIAHYQIHKQWYIQQAKVLVANARYAVQTISGSSSGPLHTFSQDEVGSMLRMWLSVNTMWQQKLASKRHLFTQYDLLTDSMARHVAWSDYIPITS